MNDRELTDRELECVVAGKAPAPAEKSDDKPAQAAPSFTRAVASASATAPASAAPSGCPGGVCRARA